MLDQKSKKELLDELNNIKKMNLSLDMSRGRPSKEQLDLSRPFFDVINSNSLLIDESGNDVRNYGEIDGIKECKRLFASIMEVNEEDVILFGNSSLNTMYSILSDAMLYGVCGSTPWSKLDKVKWLCPIPGYDRHFAICEQLGIEMINIPMNKDGPDMALVEEYIKDPLVKGIWCVPKYSNPTGITYSDEVVRRFAKLRPAAKDFRIYWDDAYAVHHLYDDRQDQLLELLNECRKNNNKDIVYKFFSTSKVVSPSCGVSALVTSLNNLNDIKSHLKIKSIGFDKINQLRHVLFFKNKYGVEEHMRKHAEILRPKFELVESIFEKELSGIATWSRPNGGYFISLYVDGKASKIIDMCLRYGLYLTNHASSFPYFNDQSNSHIRIAISCLSIDELNIAINILCRIVKLNVFQDM